MFSAETTWTSANVAQDNAPGFGDCGGPRIRSLAFIDSSLGSWYSPRRMSLYNSDLKRCVWHAMSIQEGMGLMWPFLLYLRRENFRYFSVYSRGV